MMYRLTMLRSGSCAKRRVPAPDVNESKTPSKKESIYPIEVLWKTGILMSAVSYHELGSSWIDGGKPTLYPRSFAARQCHVRDFP